MLKPAPIREIEGDRPRMWMIDSYMDLIVWYLPDGNLYGFQLCYDKEREERSLTWLHTGSFTHTRMDSGETSPLDAKATPMPVAGGLYDFKKLRQQFHDRSALIDPDLSAFVLLKLTEATLAKLPTNATHGIFVKSDSGELGPLSKDELVERIQTSEFPADPLLRFDGDSQWHCVSEFFPDQFPSARSNG